MTTRCRHRAQAPRPTGRWSDECRERFREAVRLRLMADVPLGMFLSGGIDSAAITAVMSELVDEPIKTFSVAFAEREANELAYARLVATRVCAPTTTRSWSRRTSSSRDSRKLVWHEDEPIAHPSSVALNFVSRLAAEHVKVVLTGEGSDETLAGYNRYRVTMFNHRFGRGYERPAPAALRQLCDAGICALPLASAWSRRARARTFLAQPADLDDLYFDNFAVFGRARQAELLAPAMRDAAARHRPLRGASTKRWTASTHSHLLDRASSTPT